MGILQRISYNLEALYQQTMDYLDSTYKNAPSSLVDIPVSQAMLDNIAYGQSAARHYAEHEFSSGGHAWRSDADGNITHCDGEPIGKVSL